MTEQADQAFLTVASALLDDSDADVTLEGDTVLVVHGERFAFLDGASLIVCLPTARAADLVERGIAAAGDVEGTATGSWVRIDDQEDWVELATEAHGFVGEPAVGGDS